MDGNQDNPERAARGGRSAGEPVCVGAILVDPSRRVLLGRRSGSRTWLPGLWDVPGGHCERDEPLEAALARELREELTITPRVWEHLVTAHEAGVTLHLYAVTRWHGVPENAQPEEHDTLAWLPVDRACRLPLAHAALGAALRRAVDRAAPP